MFDIAPTLLAWSQAGHAVAVATLVGVEGSAPRAVGAAMAVADTGEVAGSVSGGCVESALHEACVEVLAGGRARVLEFGSANDLIEPGLTCGGAIEVLVSDLAALGERGLLQLGLAAAGSSAELTLTRSGRAVAADSSEAWVGLRRGQDPELLIVGAVEHAVALCKLGAASGFRVTVCDPRPVFAAKERFPDAHAVIRAWPGRWAAERSWSATDALCVLSHDPKVDLPVLAAALDSTAGFVGAMGSRATCARRLDALRDAGVSEEHLARLRAPIGLDLGGRSPEHTAIAILAEILAARHGASSSPLSALTGPLHAPGTV